jgi:HEAT repeat protein
MGPRAAPAVPALLKHLEREDVNLDAAKCLGWIGKPAVPGLLAALRSKSEDLRWVAATAFEEMERDAATQAGPVLLEVLRAEPGTLGAGGAAGEALGKMQFEPDRVIPEVVERVKTSDKFDRSALMHALTAYGKTAVPAIVAALPGAPDDGWDGLVWSLAEMEGAGGTVVPVLLGILHQDKLDIRERHFAVVGALATYHAEALPGVVAMLSEESAEMRWRALRVLRRMERHAVPAFDAVRAVAKDPDERVRKAAADALGEFVAGEEPEAFPVLLEMLRGDPSASVRAEAALFLGNAREPDEFRAEVAAALVAAAGDKDEALEENAVRALGLLGERTDAVKRLILARIEKGSPDLRYTAVSSAGDLRLVEAMPALMRLLDGDDTTLQNCAIRALGRIGPPAKEALPKLRKCAVEGALWERDAREAIEKIEAR